MTSQTTLTSTETGFTYEDPTTYITFSSTDPEWPLVQEFAADDERSTTVSPGQVAALRACVALGLRRPAGSITAEITPRSLALAVYCVLGSDSEVLRAVEFAGSGLHEARTNNDARDWYAAAVAAADDLIDKSMLPSWLATAAASLVTTDIPTCEFGLSGPLEETAADHGCPACGDDGGPAWIAALDQITDDSTPDTPRMWCWGCRRLLAAGVDPHPIAGMIPAQPPRYIPAEIDRRPPATVQPAHQPPTTTGPNTMTTTIVDLRPAATLTRADHDPGPDWPEPARTLRVDSRAPERHASRVRQVEAALGQLAVDIVDNGAWDADGPEAGEARRLDVSTLEVSAGTVRTLRAIAAVELHGSGGRLGLYGGATARMSWARGLGKGRHQASDGAAWDGAIACIFGGVEEDTPEPSNIVAAARLLDESGDLTFLVNYSVWRSIESHTARESTAWTNAACRVIRVMLDDDAAASQMDAFRGLTQRVIAMDLPRSGPVVRTSDGGVSAAITYPRDEAEAEQLPLDTGRYICPNTGARGMAQSTIAPTVELVARSA